MADTPPYWLVWREDGPAPTKQHPDQHQAERETQRLAELHKGERFVVLCPVSRFSVPPSLKVERFDASDDGIPF